MVQYLPAVFPAQAGIQPFSLSNTPETLASRLRGEDGGKALSFIGQTFQTGTYVTATYVTAEVQVTSRHTRSG